MPSKNAFEQHGKEIWIRREGWDRSARTTYREDYFEELTSVTWSINNDGYFRNGKLGYLHRYIMEKWYGKGKLDEMDKKNWVVDHMDNDGSNCCISNLAFLAHDRNSAKGLTVDKEIEKMRPHIALTMCKDFTTGYYQIHVGCNDEIYLQNINTKECRVLQEISFLYDCSYKKVINEAESILLDYEEAKEFNLSKLSFIDCRARFREVLWVNEEEKDQMFIQRGDKVYFRPSEKAWIYSRGVISGWVPSGKK